MELEVQRRWAASQHQVADCKGLFHLYLGVAVEPGASSAFLLCCDVMYPLGNLQSPESQSIIPLMDHIGSHHQAEEQPPGMGENL